MGKWYVVWRGRRTGVFNNWKECLSSVQNFPYAKFKSYGSEHLAQMAFNGVEIHPDSTIKTYLCVDGACNDKKEGEYRGVLVQRETHGKTVIFGRGPFVDVTNNQMEYFAIIEGLKWIYEMGIDIPVYSDSSTAISWIKRTTQPRDWKMNELMVWWHDILTRMEREKLLLHLRKWVTKYLGEIPADYGRK
jgi:ribonuclease HI